MKYEKVLSQTFTDNFQTALLRNVKTLVSLGENGVLHFPNGIRTVFKLHY